MKPLLMISLALMLLAAGAPAATPGDGDLSGDGTLTATDRNILRDSLTGRISISASQQTHADVNGDGRITVADLVWMINQLNDKITLTLPGGVPLEMVKCPAGSFQMGSPATERSRNDDEGPLQTVKISKAFYLGIFEVTQAQWKAVMGSNPSQFQAAHGYAEDLTRPVEMVSWLDIARPATGFIAKLNAHLASTRQGGTVRLPTEAEWEYACRAGTTTRFYFGDSTKADDGATDGSTGSSDYPGMRRDYMWFWYNCQGNSNGSFGSKPVGIKKPNAFGLFDMSGNVWEWCQDWYGPYAAGTVTDPAGPTSGTSRVFRGGGWNSFASNGRSAYRLYYTPDYRYFTIGFRLALTK